MPITMYDVGQYFQVENTNPWDPTPMGPYSRMQPRARGSKAEEALTEILTAKGYMVERPSNSGHDRIINGVKTEIKFALTVDRNSDWGCIFNHIGFEKDWEKILLVCVNGDEQGNFRGVVFNKENFPKHLLRHQQGGQHSSNDDYMINRANSKELLFNSGGTVII